MFDIELKGLKEAEKELNDIIAAIKKKTVRGVYKGALEIKRTAASRRYCPVQWGNLRASAYALPHKAPGVMLSGSGVKASFPHDANYATGRPQGFLSGKHRNEVGEREAELARMPEASAIVGFTAYYSSIVHENPYAGRNNGGPKFLQRAIQNKQDAIIQHIIDENQKKGY